MEGGSATAIAPLFFRNLLTSIFIVADKSLHLLLEKYKLLELLRRLLLSTFLFFLRTLPLLFSSLLPSEGNSNYYSLKPSKSDNYVLASGGVGSSGIERALSQLLSIMNDIPVSSRKYEVVRSLAEKIIDDNLSEGNKDLWTINCTVLSAAFSRTLAQFEIALLDRCRSDGGEDDGDGVDCDVNGVVIEGKRRKVEYYGLNCVLAAVRYFGGVVWRSGRSKTKLSRSGTLTQRQGTELLWLAKKLAACGCVREAVSSWASASNLAWIGLAAEPRLQASLVKISAFLFKQSKETGKEKEEEEGTYKEKQRQLMMKMLISWLPLLCRASNGADEPVLNTTERIEMEKILEETIEMLENGEDQEKVLSLWLHHFTYCASSEWPNLHACYNRWCNASRKFFVQ